MIKTPNPGEYEHTDMATLLLMGNKIKDSFVKFYCAEQGIPTIYSFENGAALKRYIEACINEDSGCPFNKIVCYEDVEELQEDPYFEAFSICELAKIDM